MNSSESTLIFTILEEHVGKRADKALSILCDDLSRSRIKSLMDEGQVLLNGKPLVSASYAVAEGDELSITVPAPREATPQPENIPLEIIYEDDDLLVINKTAGMVVHPGAGNWSGTLVNALLHHCGDSLSGIGGVIRPGIVHRLDKDTSGLMMVAKNDHAHQSLSAQLQDRTLSRIYWALCCGVPVPRKGVIDQSIGRHRNNRLKMSVMSNVSKDAKTHYKVLEDIKGSCALVECKLDTGRTHQIRVHMEFLKHPIIGDPLYGVQPTKLISSLKLVGYSADIVKEILDFPRQMLHAKKIRFIHPTTEKEMDFESDLPSDFTKVLKKLNN